jgi:hypothetical protein
MMIVPAPQLAAMLQRAAGLRRDVKRATVEPAEHGDVLIVRASMYDGRTITREASISACLDGSTVGQILDRWFGADPGASRLEPERITANRDRIMKATAADAIVAERNRPTAAGIQPSRLDWKDAPKAVGEIGDSLPPNAIVPGPGGSSSPPVEPAEKMTRRQMMDAGMSASERQAQYRRQGGRHADDAGPATK